MLSTTTYHRADVVLVPFPFTDQSGTEFRPALVVSSDTYNQVTNDYILAMITGNVAAPSKPGDHMVRDWARAGLLQASRIRAKLATLHHSEIRRSLGTMPAPDMAAFEDNLREVLQL